jgi:hypothetical protein
MNNDMEIMREFEEEFGKEARYVNEWESDYLQRVWEWLPSAVKREICRVLKKAKDNYRKLDIERHPETKQWVSVSYLDILIREYSPAPKYCEAMQEAIKDGDVEKDEIGYKLNFRGHYQHINRCPFCPDGENCLKHDN